MGEVFFLPICYNQIVKLLLTSAGIHESFKNNFLSLLEKPVSEISVSYVITAAFGEKGDKSWINLAKKDLQKLGINDIENLDIRGKTEDELYSILSQKDIVLVNGGNTFYLLKYARESGFDKVVKRLVNEEKLYIGVSAGSYITCPTIERGYWKDTEEKINDFDITNLTGLNLIPFLITAHFEEKYRKTIEEANKTTDLPFVCLYDTQAVLVKDNLVKVVGNGKKEFYNGFKEV